MVGCAGGQSSERYRVGGYQRGVERCRGSITCRQAILHLAVGTFISRPLNRRVRGCDTGDRCAADDRRGYVSGCNCEITARGKVAGGIFRLHAIMVARAFCQGADSHGVRCHKRRIHRCRGSVARRQTVFHLAVGGFVRGPGNSCSGGSNVGGRHAGNGRPGVVHGHTDRGGSGVIGTLPHEL